MSSPLDIARQVLAQVDPALRSELTQRFEAGLRAWAQPLPAATTVVLVGHRAAGKSTLLPLVARLLGRPAVDLDELLEHQRPIRAWYRADPAGFRWAERATFAELPSGLTVAVGGGFLSNHPDLLGAVLPVLVPVSTATQLERLRGDTERPRLRPELSLDDEVRAMWAERELLHRHTATLELVDFLTRALAGRRPRRVVTLAPGADPTRFARRARAAGAELLEVRSDLTDAATVLDGAALTLPLLVAHRGPLVPAAWSRLAALEDGAGRSVRSFHAEAPLRPAEALSLWSELPEGALLKHVEPLGAVADGGRLLDTQRLLGERFGTERVTVLATGPLALPFRALLARRNALDYCALDGDWSAAVGQRLVTDAAREWRGPADDRRRGLLGSGVQASRSPMIHAQPFDRIDLPPDAPVGELLAALAPHYQGFSVTSPFKKRVAAQTANTLRRSATGWEHTNTDVDGAKAALTACGARAVTVLGDGGAADALRLAAAALGVELTVCTRRRATGALAGHLVWTWPAHVEAPPGLSLVGARVVVIAYGAAGRVVAQRITALGGEPVRLGARWFIAQARAQREFWKGASR